LIYTTQSVKERHRDLESVILAGARRTKWGHELQGISWVGQSVQSSLGEREARETKMRGKNETPVVWEMKKKEEHCGLPVELDRKGENLRKRRLRKLGESGGELFKQIQDLRSRAPSMSKH